MLGQRLFHVTNAVLAMEREIASGKLPKHEHDFYESFMRIFEIAVEAGHNLHTAHELENELRRIRESN